MQIRKFSLGILLSSWLLMGSVWAATPNIVVILADDFGLGDVGRQHTERTGNAPLAATPAIDALANEGMWFSDAHSPAALCAPSRYAVMSGNYNFRSYSPGGVWNTFGQNAIAAGDTTLGSLVKAIGYTTGFVGKWHLGGDFYVPNTTTITRRNDANALPTQIDMEEWIAGGPQQLGFDYDFTATNGVQGPTYVAHENGSWYPLGVGSALIDYDENSASDPLFVSDKGPGIGDSNWDARALNMLLADKAANFITTSAATGDPFMLYYCSPAVHIPHLPPTTIDGEIIAGSTITSHLDMNRVLDLEVKKIVDALKAAGVYEDTLIIFTSDNGGLIDNAAETAGHYSNGGFKGNKNQAFEGGHRVPFITVWPGVIPANSRCNSMVNGTDILATLAAITGASFSDSQALDSHNLYPILLGNTGYEPRSEMMQQGGSGGDLMFRQGAWKLIMSTTKGHNSVTKSDSTPWKLYNLDDNPNENDSQNLVNDSAQASRVTQMYDRYWQIRNSSARTAPSFGASVSNAGAEIINEDFSAISFGDTTGINAQITDGSYDTGLRLNNHVTGEIKTNPSFGNGHVLQLSTGTNPAGGWGAVSAANNPYPVSFSIGQEVTLSFDMLVQAALEGTANINIELRMSDATDVSRAFTEYTSASVGQTVNVSWTTVVDADMANASDISIWIPIEGVQDNYSTIGPNSNGTELDVMQIDNIKLTSSGTATGFTQFAEDNGLSGGITGDDDGDGWSNALEFVFGLNPNGPDTMTGPQVSIAPDGGDNYLTLTFPRSKEADLFTALRVWRSLTLASDSWEVGETEIVSVVQDPQNTDIEHVTVRSQFSIETNDREFLRFEVLTSE
ncbi:MAG: arylsulfatase [Verrucomicrobiota bacterium]